MELAEIYSSVLSALDEAMVPNDLREAAFVEGVRILSLGTEPQWRESSPQASATASGSVAEGSPIERIAHKMGLDTDLVSEVFHDDDGELGLGIAPSRLDKGVARGAKQIALLLAAGRQAGGYDDEWTHQATIRDMCRDFGKLDSGNFASTMKEMRDEFTYKGKGLQRAVRLTKPGWERAAALIRTLASG